MTRPRTHLTRAAGVGLAIATCLSAGCALGASAAVTGPTAAPLADVTPTPVPTAPTVTPTPQRFLDDDFETGTPRWSGIPGTSLAVTSAAARGTGRGLQLTWAGVPTRTPTPTAVPPSGSGRASALSQPVAWGPAAARDVTVPASQGWYRLDAWLRVPAGSPATGVRVRATQTAAEGHVFPARATADGSWVQATLEFRSTGTPVTVVAEAVDCSGKVESTELHLDDVTVVYQGWYSARPAMDPCWEPTPTPTTTTPVTTSPSADPLAAVHAGFEDRDATGWRALPASTVAPTGQAYAGTGALEVWRDASLHKARAGVTTTLPAGRRGEWYVVSAWVRVSPGYPGTDVRVRARAGAGRQRSVRAEARPDGWVRARTWFRADGRPVELDVQVLNGCSGQQPAAAFLLDEVTARRTSAPPADARDVRCTR